MKNTWILFLILGSCGFAFSQQSTPSSVIPDHLKKVVLLQPTGNEVDDLPEMQVLEDTTELHKKVMDNIENSFVNEFLDLYFLLQIYLKNKGELRAIEPAYLALTQNQGGFAKFGFALLEGDQHRLKSQSPYVDITIGQATQSPNRLMSFTQLYPHEMGHIFIHLLCPEDTVANNTKNVDMHFFSVITDYSTAINEGFAEHIENVSRLFEQNDSIKAGIFEDIEKIKKSSQSSINGFERDFVYPFRLGFYKASMLNWFQKYEDYVRYEHAVNGDIQYKAATLELSNTEDQLTYRNAAVRLNKQERRNLVQLYATEGAISAFFTHLSNSDLSNHYVDSIYYKLFLYDTTAAMTSPDKLFTPLQNQFIKYFIVLHRYVVFNNASKSQFTDFIDGYMESFPSEAEVVKKVFKKALGIDYSNELPPPLWIGVNYYEHRLLTFDPFDAITIPVYTFDLNAAEIEDLQTIKGVSRADANKIIAFRKSNGFFTDLEQLKTIPGLPTTISDKILSNTFDGDRFEETLDGFAPELSISALIVSPLKYIFTRGAIYFLFIYGVLYFAIIRPANPSLRKSIYLFIKYLLLWMVFILVGLAAVFFSGGQAYLFFLLFSGILILLAFFIFYKKKLSRNRTLLFMGVMSVLIMISVL